MVKLVLAINLVGITILTFVYAHLMVSPGKLIDGHAELETDCFACHKVFLGASSDKCISCHKVADIGVLTTKGVPIANNTKGASITNKKNRAPFHQNLLEQDCVACHSDHSGMEVYRIRQRFSHQLIDTATRKQCISCHRAQRPDDATHRTNSDNCAQCHTTKKWKPATVNHDKFFVLDDYHKRCSTCHRIPSKENPDYKKYTCYSCHEHTPEKIREEHLEEGIHDYENCVKCHRSTNEDEAKRAWEKLKKDIPHSDRIPVRKTQDFWMMREHDDDDD